MVTSVWRTLIVACMLWQPATALAYIDPGTGAYLVQALLAIVGAVLFYIRHPIEYIKSLFKRFTKKAGDQ